MDPVRAMYRERLSEPAIGLADKLAVGGQKALRAVAGGHAASVPPPDPGVQFLSTDRQPVPDNKSCRLMVPDVKQAHPVTIIDDPRHAAAMLGKGRSSLLRELQVPHSAQSLARRLAIPRQKLNYHLRVLERAGLVECVEERRCSIALSRSITTCTEMGSGAVARSSFFVAMGYLILLITDRCQ